MKRKWLHFETKFRSLVDELKKACIFLGIKYEVYGCFGNYGMSFYVNERETVFLNKVIEKNSICEQ